LNLAHHVGRLGADSEVSGGGSWRRPVRSYPEGRAKGWPLPTTHYLAGRIALVTGGASGLGRASAAAAEAAGLIGKAVKTVFLCRYLHDEGLR
jgi:hypothetical protein